MGKNEFIVQEALEIMKITMARPDADISKDGFERILNNAVNAAISEIDRLFSLYPFPFVDDEIWCGDLVVLSIGEKLEGNENVEQFVISSKFCDTEEAILDSSVMKDVPQVAECHFYDEQNALKANPYRVINANSELGKLIMKSNDQDSFKITGSSGKELWVTVLSHRRTKDSERIDEYEIQARVNQHKANKNAGRPYIRAEFDTIHF